MTMNRAGRVATTTEIGSLWLDAMPQEALAPLTEDLRVDVAVVGGGLTGLTTALLLKRAGLRVAVLEAERCGGGVTGNSTAKVTALQSTIYRTIRERHGAEAASTYAEASLAAVAKVAELARTEQIDCDLHRRPAFSYAPTSEELREIEAEASAAGQAGLPVRLTTDVDLPYPVAGAVRLDDQLEFQPVRYVRGLVDAVNSGSGAVYEHTRVTGVSFDSPPTVHTAAGSVRADHVVVATHYPLLDRGVFFARLESSRSYCIAAEIAEPAPEGLSISAGSPTRSIRSHNGLLVLAGESHPTGDSAASPERYQALEAFAGEHWTVRKVTHHWSAQDPSSYDKLPIIGRYTPLSPRLFVASGFMKWGLTSGTFAAMIIADQIGGRDNPWQEVFHPNRVTLRSAPTLARLNVKVAADLVGDRLRPAEADSIAAVPPGEARVVGSHREKIGVYRDEDGVAHAVSLRCTHLGCLLRFNRAERSWDCPCHGSRFDVDGAVLEGPAVRPLPGNSASDA
jgi:glycine/D-amino acid oxidase-like deaminating enzyme/nitrite reductase/ring-hydroxylating ferredoxin subunit